MPNFEVISSGNIELSTITEKGRSEELGGLSLGMKKLNFAKCLFSKQTTKEESGEKKFHNGSTPTHILMSLSYSSRFLLRLAYFDHNYNNLM